MSKTPNKLLRARRRARIRSKISGTAERPRLAVFRSNKHVYAQLIDDVKGVTLVAASETKAKTGKAKKGDSPFAKVAAAYAVGEAIGTLAKEKKIATAVFDRGGYRFTGRVKAVADGARAAGLIF